MLLFSIVDDRPRLPIFDSQFFYSLEVCLPQCHIQALVLELPRWAFRSRAKTRTIRRGLENKLSGARPASGRRRAARSPSAASAKRLRGRMCRSSPTASSKQLRTPPYFATGPIRKRPFGGWIRTATGCSLWTSSFASWPRAAWCWTIRPSAWRRELTAYAPTCLGSGNFNPAESFHY